ncbi:MAG: hypothetical protein KDE31_27655, partial [Caldilineaceae bacterium]|nr:hypothetical protein [Caldilineaceae bacterium]
MSHVTLQFLGRFSVTIDTTPVTTFHSDKARALLAYLALEPQEHNRTQLATLLWPEIDDQYARTNLRNTLHRLRQTLDSAASDAADQLLTVTRQTVQFNRQRADVDVHWFQQRIDRASASPATQIDELTAAVDAYQGELLAGFGVADAPPFEEWLLLRREALQQRALLAFHTLTTAHESAGNLSQAHAVATRLLTLDPFREESHRQIMRLL